MPAVTIDLRQAEDPRDIVHRTVQALAESKLVALPTETIYLAAASALSPDAVARLIAAVPEVPLEKRALAVKSADDALDYLPDLSPMGRRLMRRCWPGPLLVRAATQHPESVLTQLPAETRRSVAPQGEVGLRVPHHDVILSVLRLSIGPLVVVPVPVRPSSGSAAGGAGGCPVAVEASEVVESIGSRIDVVLDGGRTKYAQPATMIALERDRWSVLEAGVIGELALQRLASMMILLVCTGNTCRSPMAEQLMRRHLAKRVGCDIDELDRHGVVVASAGVAAMPGGRPSAEAVEAMARLGLDLTEHLSQPVTERLVRQADLILTMTQGHRQAILNQWPDLASRAFVVSRDRRDVADPIGGPLPMYEECARQLDEHLAAWAAEVPLPERPEK
ncbi:MAG TPA: Sua5/YciO/YrdC/YwlC family protein [Pirellulaceae bacterium]|nr:Sua5/YciO/YrdC/YwlC family protein [Pirellulaceae bacterium]